MYFDTHTHTKYSCDCSKEPVDAIESAISKGLSGIAFTDHSDLRFFDEFDLSSSIPASAREAVRLSQEYEGKIKVFTGIEISDAACPHLSHLLEAALAFHDNYDIILASVHNIDLLGKSLEISSTDFSRTSYSMLEKIVGQYFEDMLKTVYENDFSTLCHMTYPLRYINGIHKRGYSLCGHMKIIEDIFKVIIDKNTALEINTAKCTEQDPFAFSPQEDLIKLYISLGGKMFTLASDSHIAGSEGRYFDKAAELLRKNGIYGCYYFESRKPIYYEI